MLGDRCLGPTEVDNLGEGEATHLERWHLRADGEADKLSVWLQYAERQTKRKEVH